MDVLLDLDLNLATSCYDGLYGSARYSHLPGRVVRKMEGLNVVCTAENVLMDEVKRLAALVDEAIGTCASPGDAPQRPQDSMSDEDYEAAITRCVDIDATKQGELCPGGR